MEEKLPRHHLTIAVDNVQCIPGWPGTCAKGIILKYGNSIATLNIIPSLDTVQVGYYITIYSFIVCHVAIPPYTFGFIDADHFL